MEAPAPLGTQTISRRQGKCKPGIKRILRRPDILALSEADTGEISDGYNFRCVRVETDLRAGSTWAEPARQLPRRPSRMARTPTASGQAVRPERYGAPRYRYLARQDRLHRREPRCRSTRRPIRRMTPRSDNGGWLELEATGSVVSLMPTSGSGLRVGLNVSG